MAVISQDFGANDLAMWPFGPTPAYLVGRALNVLSYVNTLHQQILSSDVEQAFKDAWGLFYRSAANYLVVVVQSPPWLATAGVEEQIESYAAQAIQWRVAFEQAGGHPVGPAVQPIEPTPSKTPGWLKWVVGGGVVALVGYAVVRTGVWERIGSRLRSKKSKAEA